LTWFVVGVIQGLRATLSMRAMQRKGTPSSRCAQGYRAADVVAGYGGGFEVQSLYELGEEPRLARDRHVEVFWAFGLAEAGEVEGVDAEPVGEPEGDVAPDE
jgi:hypothetical protein